jgi:hypothetical protein
MASLAFTSIPKKREGRREGEEGEEGEKGGGGEAVGDIRRDTWLLGKKESKDSVALTGDMERCGQIFGGPKNYSQ